jgi:hypothetical protein
MLNSPRRSSAARRLWLLRATPLVLAAMVTAMLPMLSSGAAAAGIGAPVPVAGVAAFGIGAGQLGNFANTPDGVAVDSKGDLFAVDQADNRVIEYVPSSPTSYPKVGTVVAGAGGEGSGLNQLNDPSGVAIDAHGDLFVGDSANNRVVEYAYNASAGTYASSGTVVAGTGVAGSGLNQLGDPGGIALDAKGDLFVADTSNNRVEEFAYNNASASYASTATEVAGTGGSGTKSNQLELPASVALSPEGNLLVADYANARVMEYTYNSSTGTYSTSGTQIATFPDPTGWLAFDASGDLFVSYGYLGYGEVTEFAYNSATGSYATSGTEVDPSAMLGPEGLAFNPSGDLFVAETSETSDPSQTVWDMVLELVPGPSGTFTPLGTIMAQVGRTNGGISAVALDSHGNLFVSDGVSNGGGPAGVFEFPFSSSTGTYSATGTPVTATAGTALALDSNNDLFVAQTTTGVLEYPYSSSGYPVTGEAAPGATQLSSLAVTAVAFDSHNDLFAATGSEVLEFPYSSSNGTWAASGTVVAAPPAGKLPTDYDSFFTGVAGVTLDANGDLFVSNPTASDVLEYLYNASTGTYAATGLVVAGAGGTGTGLNQLYEPTGVAVDHSGDLFVFDASNGRVMEFTGNSATGAYAANGTEVYNLGSDNYPQNGGMALDAQGDLFFGDDDNSAVVYEAPVTSTTSPTTTTDPPTTTTDPPTTTTDPPTTTVPPTTTTDPPTTTVPPTTTTDPPTTTVPPTTTTVRPTTTTVRPTTTTTVPPTTTTTVPPTTTTTTVPPTTTTVRPTTTTTTTTVPPSNLVPDPNFASSAVPADYWGSTLARESTVVYPGSAWALAQTTSSSSGGWDLDDNPSWYAPVSSADTYSAYIWVQATAAVKVDIGVDLLTSSGSYVDTASGPWVTLVPNTWTQLPLTGIKPTASEVYAGMEPDFSKATKSTVIYWDNMSLTS